MRRAGALFVVCLVVAIAAPAAASPIGGAVSAVRTVRAANDVLAAGRAQAFRFTETAVRTVGAIEIYAGTSSTARGLTVGVYGNARGHPGPRLVSDSVSNISPGAWKAVTVAPFRLLKGHVYWVAVLARDGSLDLRVRSAARCESELARRHRLTRVPGSWSHSPRAHGCPTPFRLIPSGTSAPGGGSGGAGGTAPSAPISPASAPGLRVSGDAMTDGGQVVHLHGVNRSGTEYACIQGWGIFDGPSDDASVAAIAGWHANIVRVPVNEDCWLGINGVKSEYGGQNYIDALVNYVNLLHAVNVMRQAGYHGPIAIPCIDYANDCADGNGSWVGEMPTDPDNQLLAEAHVYGKNACDTTACLDSTMLPILQAGHPLIFGETGETYDSSDCGSSYISTFIGWADAHGVGHEPWTWDTWGGCGVLISDYNGTPANAYGSWVQRHYAALG